MLLQATYHHGCLVDAVLLLAPPEELFPVLFSDKDHAGCSVHVLNCRHTIQ
jgi:hypothetical protein